MTLFISSQIKGVVSKWADGDVTWRGLLTSFPQNTKHFELYLGNYSSYNWYCFHHTVCQKWKGNIDSSGHFVWYNEIWSVCNAYRLQFDCMGFSDSSAASVCLALDFFDSFQCWIMCSFASVAAANGFCKAFVVLWSCKWKGNKCTVWVVFLIFAVSFVKII